MITNFEEYTEELTDVERDVIVPGIIKGLATKIGKEKAITNKQMQKGILEVLNIKTSSSRIRKMIHYIRITGMIHCLVATSRGYYISNNKEELDSYIESLIQRSESIMSIADQLQFQLKSMNN